MHYFQACSSKCLFCLCYYVQSARVLAMLTPTDFLDHCELPSNEVKKSKIKFLVYGFTFEMNCAWQNVYGLFTFVV